MNNTNQVLKIPGTKERKREAKEKIMESNDKIMKQCDSMLLALLGKQSYVDEWWKSQNKAFGQLTPREMFEVDPSYVRGYLLDQCDYVGS